jgi:hypothetical protein
MSCCGSQRAAMRYEPPSAEGRNTTYFSPGPRGFVYTGPGVLTVIGPLTGITYTFTSGGPAIPVHASDVASLAAVPGLTAR